MTELDIRLGITGLRLENKEQIEADINNTLKEYESILDVPCNTKENYKLYKDVRKELKEDRNEIWSSVKEKVATYTSDILNDQKELYGKFDELYNSIDKAIKAYEEENEVGAAKAKITRDANKAAKAEQVESLSLTLQCPSAEVKRRIIQFATDLGAVVK